MVECFAKSRRDPAPGPHVWRPPPKQLDHAVPDCQVTSSCLKVIISTDDAGVPCWMLT